MNQETIPDNNLPVYLQKYDVKIFDDKKESVGKVLYTTVGAIPSNQKEKRVWSLNLTGYLKPNVDTYNIVYDFSKVDYKYKDEITFENIISGIFTICGRVLDASKIIGFDYKYNDEESTLTIELDTSKWDFQLKKEVLFSYDLNVDDKISIICDKSEKIDLNTPYDLYLQVVDCETSDNNACYLGSCNSNKSNVCVINIGRSVYFNFTIDSTINGYDFGTMEAAASNSSVSACVSLDGCYPTELQLSYNCNQDCVLVPSEGKSTTITDSNGNSVNVKYTKTSSFNPCTVCECIGNNELSDYYLGTIEFSTTSSS